MMANVVDSSVIFLRPALFSGTVSISLCAKVEFDAELACVLNVYTVWAIMVSKRRTKRGLVPVKIKLASSYLFVSRTSKSFNSFAKPAEYNGCVVTIQRYLP